MSPSPPPSPSTSQTPRRRLNWKQRGLLLLFGLMLALLPELALRWAGLGGSAPLLRTLPFTLEESGVELPAQTRLYEIHPRVADVFFARDTPGGDRLAGGHGRELVLLPKPTGTFRVVFAGASSVEGFPMPRNLTAARFLEAWLQQLLPDRHVEVINLGVAAVASFPVRKLAEQALDQLDPDLLLLYGGHNEFYGAGGVASYQFMGTRPWSMELSYRLRRSAMVQLAEALLRPSSDTAAMAAAPTADREQLIQVMAAIDRVEPGGALHDTARRNLEHNFRAVLRHARRRGVPVLLGTLVSNERDLAPLAAWQEAAGDGARDLDASRHYAHARDLEARGDPAAAEAFRLARDLDAMPWRGARDKNEMLRRLAAEESATLADCEASFARAAQGATGWGQFADHVHPSPSGQALLARCFLDAAAAAGVVEVAAVETLPPWSETASRLGAHPLEIFLLAHKMSTLFREPPMNRNNEAAAAMTTEWVETLRRRADAVDQDAIRRWEDASRLAGRALPISVFGGVAALVAGDLPRARGYLQAAVANAPPYSDPRCAARLLLLWTERHASLVTDPSGGQSEGSAGEQLRQHVEAARQEVARVVQLTATPSALLSRVSHELALLAAETPPPVEGEAASGVEQAWLQILDEAARAVVPESAQAAAVVTVPVADAVPVADMVPVAK